jgi:hypothetical protein
MYLGGYFSLKAGSRLFRRRLPAMAPGRLASLVTGN